MIYPLIVPGLGGTLLLDPKGALPTCECERFWTREHAHFTEATRALFGVPAHLLYRPWQREKTQLAVVELLGPLAAESSFSWQPLTALRVPEPEWAAPIVAALIEPAPPERAAWSRPGWFAATERWLESHGLGGSLTEVRSWSLSCVLAGPGYFVKATNPLPLFANEPAVTAALAALLPGWVPAPRHSDPENNIMVLADFGPPLGDEDDGTALGPILAAHARLQRQLIGRESELLAAGCLDRRPAVLAQQLAALLADDEVLAPLTDDERAVLHTTDWATRCAALAAGPIPCTLVHGDLHLGNVAPRGDDYLIFDWTDACVAHPFFDLLEVFFVKDAERYEALLDAYLALWADCAPLDSLRAHWESLKPLCALHHAVSYWQIDRGLEPTVRHEHTGNCTFFLQQAVACLTTPEPSAARSVL